MERKQNKIQRYSKKYIFKLVYINFLYTFNKTKLHRNSISITYLLSSKLGIVYILYTDEITQSQTEIKYTLKTKYILQAILSIFIYFYGRISRRKHKL